MTKNGSLDLAGINLKSLATRPKGKHDDTQSLCHEMQGLDENTFKNFELCHKIDPRVKNTLSDDILLKLFKYLSQVLGST